MTTTTFEGRTLLVAQLVCCAFMFASPVLVILELPIAAAITGPIAAFIAAYIHNRLEAAFQEGQGAVLNTRYYFRRAPLIPASAIVILVALIVWFL